MYQYYELTHEVEIDGRWYLAEITDSQNNEISSHVFREGRSLSFPSPPVIVPNIMGRPLDFTLTSFGVPIVSKEFADNISKIASGAIQRIPVLVKPHIEGYEILNILNLLACLDYERTVVSLYNERFGEPSLVGKINYLANITIQPSESQYDIFRLAEWNIIIIVSETIKRLLEQSELIGFKFVSVT